MSELKPCPWCGEQPEVTKHFREEAWSLVHRCPVLATPITFDWTTQESIESRWNRRTPARSE